VKAPEGMTNEYAFLKIRYKKPDGDTSKLMTRPITTADETSFDNLSDDLRFASSVAGFGQLLRNSKFVGNFTYDKVIEMANAARGKDEHGYRTEFVNLVRLAKSAAGNDKDR
jgi:Ca-activated chloride channel homolog